MAITYHTQDLAFDFAGEKLRTSRWIKAAVAEEGCTAGNICVVFCSDRCLIDINRKHLNHNYFTDIITFDYSRLKRGGGKEVSGDLFISVETVRDNADLYCTAFGEELRRVIIHGVLHLIGYGDKTPEEAHIMRKKENAYLKTYGK